MVPSLAYGQTFPDVPSDSIHSGAVEYLYSHDVIAGYPNGDFAPDKTINRAEALKIVVLAAGLSTDETGEGSFSDVSSTDWFDEFVRIGVANEVVEGYDDNSFKPGLNINVAESLKIIFLAFGEDVGAEPLKDPFPDVEANIWYSTYAQYAKDKQFVWTQNDGKLHAERDITRGEFSQIIYRLLYVRDNDLETFPISTDWPTFENNQDGYSIKYPFGWEQISAGDQVIFWHQDSANEQLSWARVYPNSATMVIASDNNESRLSLEDYLAFIQYDESAQIQKMTLNGFPFASVSLMSSGTIDYYFEMPNKSILVAYCQVGSGLNQGQLLEQIRYMVGSLKEAEIKSVPVVSDRDLFLGGVRALILENGEGQSALDLFDDLVLIDTDSIGIGTGPVDYYYSAVYDISLKYERDSVTLLAISDGQGTAF